MKTIAIDFDGTIAGIEHFPDIGEPEPGVVHAIRALKVAGYLIVIHSCRLSRGEFPTRAVEAHRLAVQAFLSAHGIPYDHIWMEEGKPIAWAYIDDKGIRYEKNWPAIEAMLLGPLMPNELRKKPC